MSTLSANVDLGPYLERLAPDGAFVTVGLPTGPLSLDVSPLARRRRSVAVR